MLMILPSVHFPARQPVDSWYKLWYLSLLQTISSSLNPYRTELVFQISSHFQHWRLYCIYFAHRSLSLPKHGSFSDMEYYFYYLAYRDSKVQKRLVGLNQMQCSPSFDWNCGKQNDPTACWYQLHPRFQVLQQGKCLRYPPERVGGVNETTICVGGEGAVPPSNPS